LSRRRGKHKKPSANDQPGNQVSGGRQELRDAPKYPGFSVDTYRGIAILAAGTLVLKSLIFAPISFWPLSFVCLVPWLVMVGAGREARLVYVFSYLLGLLFFLWNMRWLWYPTGVGYVALSVYLACYFPLAACPIRHAVRRRCLPLALVAPLVWVGGEMLRAVVISGFPWFFLAHSPHEVLTLIQVSDLVGAYGLSFVIAAVNGAAADVILAILARRRAVRPDANRHPAQFGALFAALLLIATCVYGHIQLSADTMGEGPTIAVVQGDFISKVSGEGLAEDEKKRLYFSMLDSADAHDPDMVLLPESAWWMFLNPEKRDLHWLSRDSFAAFQDYATRGNTCVVTGCGAWVDTPHDLLAKERRYNSAMVFSADGSEPQRYDKIHLVYFGEIVPFRFGNFRFLYLWINSLMPFSGPDNDEYSYFPGTEFRTFAMEAPSREGELYRFSIPICYEDVMPYVSREFVSGGASAKRCDFLLNISNDGWFGRGIQQPQHLAICVFRAVENRVGIARAVNTGVSAFIKPTGEVHDIVTGDPSTPWPGECGYSVASVSVDSRYTLYSRLGDWFGWGCVVLWFLLYVDRCVVRARARANE